MKISAELIQGANQYINPMKDRELDLKGILQIKFLFVNIYKRLQNCIDREYGRNTGNSLLFKEFC